MAASSGTTTRPPALLTLVGLLTIGSMVAMPLLAGSPDGEQVAGWVKFLGRFHPVLLHLPIGIVSLALILEIARVFSKDKPNSGAGSLVLGLGAASAVVAVIAGFLLYHGGGYEGSETAARHLWGGIIFASAMIVTFLAKAWTDAAGGGVWLYKLALLGSSGVMAFASHDGGTLTHGEGYLTDEAPAPIRKLLGLPVKEEKGGEKGEPAKPVGEQVVYSEVVMPILERRCVACHNPDKIKGKFRMDTYELLVKGGKEGPGIELGNAAKSNIIIRAELPRDDDESMPPDGKTPLNANELAVIKWWLNSGGDPKKTVAELSAPADVLEAIGKLQPVSLKTGVAKVEIPGDEAPHAAAPTGPDAALKKQLAGFAKDFPGSLTFESQQSSAVTFTAVSLRGNLDDKAFEKLSPVLKHFVTADLSATKVTDKSVAMLAGSENLRMIRLSETAVTDAAIDTLITLPKLESVNLYGTAVTDAGVAKLAVLPNLKHLYLWQTKVTPAAIEELKKKLPKCEIVTGV